MTKVKDIGKISSPDKLEQDQAGTYHDRTITNVLNANNQYFFKVNKTCFVYADILDVGLGKLYAFKLKANGHKTYPIQRIFKVTTQKGNNYIRYEITKYGKSYFVSGNPNYTDCNFVKNKISDVNELDVGEIGALHNHKIARAPVSKNGNKFLITKPCYVYSNILDVGKGKRFDFKLQPNIHKYFKVDKAFKVYGKKGVYPRYMFSLRGREYFITGNPHCVLRVDPASPLYQVQKIMECLYYYVKLVIDNEKGWSLDGVNQVDIIDKVSKKLGLDDELGQIVEVFDKSKLHARIDTSYSKPKHIKVQTNVFANDELAYLYKPSEYHKHWDIDDMYNYVFSSENPKLDYDTQYKLSDAELHKDARAVAEAVLKHMSPVEKKRINHLNLAVVKAEALLQSKGTMKQAEHKHNKHHELMVVKKHKKPKHPILYKIKKFLHLL